MSNRANWILLLTLILLAIAVGIQCSLESWLVMWLLAGALWVGFKLMALQNAGGFETVSLYYFGWIGTDAVAFRKLGRGVDRSPTMPPHLHGFQSALFIIMGAALVLIASPRITNPILTGWIGILAMLCLLHFGIFSLLALFWRRFGFPVETIMNKPWNAKNLGEFWGPRWNRAFSDWARMQIFRPLVRKFGTTRGTLAGFFASGLAHELVISLPARDGWGLPTLYFLIQAFALLIQRNIPSLRNRFCTLAVVLLPAPALFHPPFLKNVFTPMMNLIPPLL